MLSGATNFYCYWKDIDIWVVMATMCLCFFFEIYKYEFNVYGAGHPATTVRLFRTITGQPLWRGHLLLTTWVRAE